MPPRAAYFLVFFLALLAAAPARGQADSTQAAWRLIVEGRVEAWVPARPLPPDSLGAVAREALAMLQREGFYFARIDSARRDTTAAPPEIQLFATRGPAVAVGAVRLEGAEAFAADDLLRLLDTRPGRRLDPARLEADLDAILARYERAGFPLARAVVEDVRLLPGEPPRLDLTLRIDEGPALALRRVEVPGAERTKAAYVARVAGLQPGRPLAGYDPATIQQRLEATAFFQTVGLPELIVEPDSGAVIRIEVAEEPPGSFDLVLGYLPPAGSQGRGSLVGNGHLILRNLFGAGREMALRLNRLPGRVSAVDVRAADPFILGLPLRAEGQFEGFQQDSTFGKQRYGAELGVHLAGGFQLFGTLRRELTKPGEGGQRLVGGRQQVARADAFFAGIGLRLLRLDRRLNPRRGLAFETNFERGRKERAAREVVGPDTTRTRTLLRQERLRAQLRLYVPTRRRQVAVAGADALVLLSDAFDVSDLFRFGGATSLRGYDEERFLVPTAGRLFAEYRYQLDRTSYGFVFFDLGYVERPAVVGLDEALRGFYPGYGLGFQVGTDLGLIVLSLAANPDEPSAVRAHLGLSLGL